MTISKGLTTTVAKKLIAHAQASRFTWKFGCLARLCLEEEVENDYVWSKGGGPTRVGWS